MLLMEKYLHIYAYNGWLQHICIIGKGFPGKAINQLNNFPTKRKFHANTQ